MAKVGRQSKYETHVKPYFTLIKDMLRNGAIDKDVYKKLDVGKNSFYEYKKKYKEFSDILKTNKDIVDAEVENELLERAKSHKIKEEKAFKIKYTKYNEEGFKISEEERIEVVELEREIPGDVTAQIFWLKNRRPKQWRDRPVDEIETSAINDLANAIRGIK